MMTMKNARRRFGAGVAIALLGVAGAIAYPTVFKTGLTISKPGVQPGYVIIGAPDGNAYAIDVKGEVAGKWAPPEGIDRKSTRLNSSH